MSLMMDDVDLDMGSFPIITGICFRALFSEGWNFHGHMSKGIARKDSLPYRLHPFFSFIRMLENVFSIKRGNRAIILLFRKTTVIDKDI
ncbi:hypothetical protein TNCT_49901 [Trichonephila clavata]|uniref:Uncharacterized protein n=1 Tax=Trichonephila clavata TaxID=2740835 RepID=A0A8X6GXE7_TRICU|nr:hypothetical protein TNCT_49901 [Trichonephila clavata]